MRVDDWVREFACFARKRAEGSETALDFFADERHADDGERSAAPRRSVDRGDDAIRAAAVDGRGRRPKFEAKALVPLLTDAERRIRDAAFAALVHLGDANVRSALEGAICKAPANATDAQLIGLLRLGSTYALSVCRASASHDGARRGHLIGVALAGGPGDWHLLAQQLARSELRGAAVEAIGLHGEPRAVPVLIDLLEQGDLLAEITSALHTITGVQQGPRAAQWRAWWDVHEWKFAPGRRHREGRPFSLFQCIGAVSKGRDSSVARQQALAELEIRSGQRYPFDLDGPFERQTAVLAEWQQWWTSAEERFRPGRWTFQGAAAPPSH